MKYPLTQNKKKTRMLQLITKKISFYRSTIWTKARLLTGRQKTSARPFVTNLVPLLYHGERTFPTGSDNTLVQF